MLRMLIVFLILLVWTLPPAHALPPKVSAIATTATYGAVGGALLGTAAMAFGAKPRAVAIGASLGLYAGILFGVYVIMTHEYGKSEEGGEEAQARYRWEQYRHLNENQLAQEIRPTSRRDLTAQTTSINLLQVQF